MGHEAETLYTLPVTEAGTLIGVMSLRDRVLSDDARRSVTSMAIDVDADADDDQEVVARRVQDTDVLAVPVVGAAERSSVWSRRTTP